MVHVAAQAGGMWTKKHRARQAAFERRRDPTDLTDEEWKRIRPLLPDPAGRGRPPEVDRREVLNAIRTMARSGGGWRMLPVHFGPWRTVHWWLRRFMRRLLFQTIHDIALMPDREQAGREGAQARACWTARPWRRRTPQAAVDATQPGGPGGASATWPWTRTGGC